MTRFIIQNRVTNPDDFAAFSYEGFEYEPTFGEPNYPHFIKQWTEWKEKKQIIRKLIELYCLHHLKQNTIPEVYQLLAEYACLRPDHVFIQKNIYLKRLQ